MFTVTNEFYFGRINVCACSTDEELNLFLNTRVIAV